MNKFEKFLTSPTVDWPTYYNNDRTHQGKMCCGRTPMKNLIDEKEAWHDKITTLNSSI